MNLDEWEPVGISQLEPAALEVARATGSACVFAGPGSGKTELLAQRATFLMQSGLCRPPHRVLAISFKKDSATNLAARVAARTSSEQASRFDSMTFDAFTKSIVDRFRLCLPEVWRPRDGLRPLGSTRAEFKCFIDHLVRYRPNWQQELSNLTLEKFEQEQFCNYHLPVVPTKADDALTCAILNWAKAGVASEESISFAVLNRLAEMILREGPVRRALLATYPHVFVDEFQDTSHGQYDLLVRTFARGGSNLTAVGDGKQRIMLWAGAKPDAFSALIEELAVDPSELVYNYRSSAALVSLQQVVSGELDPNSPAVESRAVQVREIRASDAIQIWLSKSRAEEVTNLARWICRDQAETGNSPSDYAILVRQKPDEFESELQPFFRECGLKVMNHNRLAADITLQDLLKDELSLLNLELLRLASGEANPRSWESVRSTYLYLKQVDPGDDDPAVLELEEHVQRAVETIRSEMSDLPVDEVSVTSICEVLEDLFPDNLWVRGFSAYQGGDGLRRSRDAFRARMNQVVLEAPTWRTAVTDFGGEDAIPIMSIHKSKGLEFHTVLHLGFDDSSWWSYRRNEREGDSTFFVALSRAKSRLLFLHNESRGRRREIGKLFDFLERAGVTQFQIGTSAV